MANLNGVVDHYLNSKYDKVRQVADNLEKILLVADNLQLSEGVRGEAGTTPVKGTDYFDGRKGNGIIFAFRNAPAAPPTPGGGSFDGITSVPPTNWTNDPSTPPAGAFTWIVMTTYLAVDDSNTWNNNGWSAAARLTGDAGVTPTKGQDYFDGNDGAFRSFIFRNSATTPNGPIDGSFDGVTETIPVGWTDDPTSPNTGDVTWVCKALYTHNGASWNKVGWSAPSQFSGTEGITPVKGVDYFDGANGVYVSFVYKLAAIQPLAPVGGTFDGTPQNEAIPTGWADDPSAPSTGVFIWISTRKYEKVGENWVGTDWDFPSKFSGEDGYTPVKGLDYLDAASGRFTSYIFRNAVSIPATPAGGSFNGTLQQETTPTDWDDDPSASAPGEITWVCKAIYEHDASDNSWSQNGWSIPVEFSGQDGLAGAGFFTLLAITNSTVTPNSITSTIAGTYLSKAIGLEYFIGSWLFSFTTNTSADMLVGIRPDTGGGASLGGIGTLSYGIIRNGATNVISVIEGGSDRGSFGTVNNTDVLSISNVGGTVYYRKNGAIFYTSLVEVTVAQALGVFLSGAGDSVDNLTISVSGEGTAGADGVRGSSRYFKTIPGTAWTNALGEAAITDTGATKVPFDVVTLNNPAANPSFTHTRVWNGAAWTVLAEVIDGGLLVDGTVIAKHIGAGTITADLVDTANFKIGAVLGDMKSITYTTGTIGWELKENGNATFENITAKSGLFSGALSCAGGNFQVAETGVVTTPLPNNNDKAIAYAETDTYGVAAIVGYNFYGAFNGSSYGILGESLYGDGVRGISTNNDGVQGSTSAASRGGVRAINALGPQLIVGSNTGSGPSSSNPYPGLTFPTVVVGGLLGTRLALYYGTTDASGTVPRWRNLLTQQEYAATSVVPT